MKLSKKSIVFLSLILFFYATEELGMGSWIPTYSIKAGIADTDSAALYSFIFWTSNCLCRLCLMYMPGTVERKIRVCLRCVIISLVVGLILQWV